MNKRLLNLIAVIIIVALAWQAVPLKRAKTQGGYFPRENAELGTRNWQVGTALRPRAMAEKATPQFQLSEKAQAKIGEMDALFRRYGGLEVGCFGLVREDSHGNGILVDMVLPEKVLVVDDYFFDSGVLQSSQYYFCKALSESNVLTLQLSDRGELYFLSDQPKHSFWIQDAEWEDFQAIVSQLAHVALPISPQLLRDLIYRNGPIPLDMNWDIFIMNRHVSYRKTYLDRVLKEASLQSASASYSLHYHPEGLLYSPDDLGFFVEHEIKWADIRAPVSSGNAEQGTFVYSRYRIPSEVNKMEEGLFRKVPYFNNRIMRYLYENSRSSCATWLGLTALFSAGKLPEDADRLLRRVERNAARLSNSDVVSRYQKLVANNELPPLVLSDSMSQEDIKTLRITILKRLESLQTAISIPSSRLAYRFTWNILILLRYSAVKAQGFEPLRKETEVLSSVLRPQAAMESRRGNGGESRAAGKTTRGGEGRPVAHMEKVGRNGPNEHERTIVTIRRWANNKNVDMLVSYVIAELPRMSSKRRVEVLETIVTTLGEGEALNEFVSRVAAASDKLYERTGEVVRSLGGAVSIGDSLSLEEYTRLGLDLISSHHPADGLAAAVRKNPSLARLAQEFCQALQEYADQYLGPAEELVARSTTTGERYREVYRLLARGFDHLRGVERRSSFHKLPFVALGPKQKISDDLQALSNYSHLVSRGEQFNQALVRAEIERLTESIPRHVRRLLMVMERYPVLQEAFPDIYQALRRGPDEYIVPIRELLRRNPELLEADFRRIHQDLLIDGFLKAYNEMKSQYEQAVRLISSFVHDEILNTLANSDPNSLVQTTRRIRAILECHRRAMQGLRTMVGVSCVVALPAGERSRTGAHRVAIRNDGNRKALQAI